MLAKSGMLDGVAVVFAVGVAVGVADPARGIWVHAPPENFEKLKYM